MYVSTAKGSIHGEFLNQNIRAEVSNASWKELNQFSMELSILQQKSFNPQNILAKMETIIPTK